MKSILRELFKIIIYLSLIILFSSTFTIAQNDSNWFNSHIRRIHMDFHTPEIAPDVIIKNFNAKEYVKVLKDAHVNSLVTFAKGHHGNSYYNTKIGHKHSGLPDSIDMFGEILEECHNNNIKVLAYYSIGWLTTVEQNYPEWMQRNIEGETTGTSGRHHPNGWNCICLNAPYIEKVVLPELEELATNYLMDGIWLDIIENSPCFCQWCKEKYQRKFNRSYPTDESELIEFANQTRKEAVSKIVKTLKDINPNLLVSFNTAGRDPKLVPMVDFCSIETHPGATWHQGAWTHSLLTMKSLQRFGKPWESTTSRFIHGWGGWDDQTTENMMVVASRIAAHGGVINLGDQTYPNGQLDKELYKKIEKVFSHIKKMERWTLQSTSYASVGVFATPFDIYSIYRDPHEIDNYLGAAKILTDSHLAFDLLVEGDYTDLFNYKVLVLPNVGELQRGTIDDITKFVQEGGKIIVSGNSSLSESSNEFGLSQVLGINYDGLSPYSHGYLLLDESISKNVRKSALLTPGQLYEVNPYSDSKILSKHIYPILEPKPYELLFFRNPELSPPGKESQSPGIVQNTFGKGEAIYVAAPIFKIFLEQSQWYLSDVIKNIFDYIDPDLPVTLDAPKSVEMYLTKKDNHLIVHLINYFLHKETNQVEEINSVNDIVLKVKTDFVKPQTMKVIGSETGFTKIQNDKYITIELKKLELYNQIVFELL